MKPDDAHAIAAKRHLDSAMERLRLIGHEVPHDPSTERLRRLVEYAAAYVREAWIEADGQRADEPPAVAVRCTAAFRLLDRAREQAEGMGVVA